MRWLWRIIFKKEKIGIPFSLMISVKKKSFHRKSEGGEIIKPKVAGHIVMNIIPQALIVKSITLHCHLEVRDWRIKAIKRIGLKIMYADFYLRLNNISEGISTFCSLLASRPWSLQNVVVGILFCVTSQDHSFQSSL